MTIDYLRNKFASFKPTYFSTPFKPAAVAIIFFRKNGLTHVLFVKRQETLKEHAGQISFPGGRYDLEDTHLMQTVIRETIEEVGISLSEEHFLAQADDFITNTHYHVRPFLFYLDSDITITLSGEHSHYYKVPLSFLLDKKNEISEKLVYRNFNHTMYTYYIEDDKIWGATGCILQSVLSLLR